MKSVMAALGIAGMLDTRTLRDGNIEHVRWEQRGIFNAVKIRLDYRAMCNGVEPIGVETFHTVGDGFAAVLTGILWTPAHVRVICAPAAASR